MSEYGDFVEHHLNQIPARFREDCELMIGPTADIILSANVERAYIDGVGSVRCRIEDGQVYLVRRDGLDVHDAVVRSQRRYDRYLASTSAANSDAASAA